jgi:hypothetical protein
VVAVSFRVYGVARRGALNCAGKDRQWAAAEDCVAARHQDNNSLPQQSFTGNNF